MVGVGWEFIERIWERLHMENIAEGLVFGNSWYPIKGSWRSGPNGYKSSSNLYFNLASILETQILRTV